MCRGVNDICQLPMKETIKYIYNKDFCLKKLMCQSGNDSYHSLGKWQRNKRHTLAIQKRVQGKKATNRKIGKARIIGYSQRTKSQKNKPRKIVQLYRDKSPHILRRIEPTPGWAECHRLYLYTLRRQRTTMKNCSITTLNLPLLRFTALVNASIKIGKSIPSQAQEQKLRCQIFWHKNKVCHHVNDIS